MNIDGVGAIVTGGGSGLGAAVAAFLAQGGAKVSIVDRDRKAAMERAAEIGGLGLAADVTEEKDVAHVVAAAAEQHGVTRILVNCAGIGPSCKTVRRDGTPHPVDLFRKVLAVNLLGSFAMLSRVAAALANEAPLGEERGVIINTASIAAFDGQVGQAAYSASKAGLAGMTLPIARDLAPLAIRVVTIAPGAFMTPMLETVSDEIRQSLAKQVPFPQRLGRPQEFAELVGHTIANPMINGETIRIDGAIRMAPH
jgi:NAD(P)-dependent dehydrogenase (short-subunit alcohol dehydrogenase family)